MLAAGRAREGHDTVACLHACMTCLHTTGSGSICVIAGGGSGDARGAEIVGGHAKATTAVAAATVGAVGTAIKGSFLPCVAAIPWGAAGRSGGEERRGGAEEGVVAGERMGRNMG